VPLHSQEALPEIIPIRTVPLVAENDPTQFAYRNLVIDGKGRLWLKTAGVAEQSYGMQVLQFDGYNRWTIDVAKEKWKDIRGGHLENFTDNNCLYGYLNDPKQRLSTLYTFDIANKNIQYTPMPEGLVGTIERYDSSRFWVLEKTRDAFKIHQWDGTTLDHFTSISNASHFSQEHGFLKASDTDLIYQDSILWILDDNLPIISYDLTDHSIKRYTREFFPVGEAPLNEKINYDNDDLEIRGAQVFVVHNAIGNQFYVMDKQEGEVFMPLGLVAENTRAHSVWKDEQDNLLFLVECLNAQKDKMGAYLLDASNQLFDYSPMIKGMPRIRSVLSKDFKQQLYLGTASGAYFVQAGSQNAITTYRGMKGGLRYIRQIGNDAFLLRSQRSWLQIIQDNRLFNIPEGHCLANKDDFEGGIMLLSDPTGKVWLKSKYALSRYEPAADGSCIHYTFEDAVRKAIFLTEHQLALIDQNTNQLSIYDLRDKSYTKLSAFSNLSKNGVWHDLLSAPGHILWLTTNDGLYRVDWAADEVQHFGGTADFVDNRIIAIHDDQKGQLWLGTVNSGIQIFDKARGKVVKVIDESDGLSNDIVVGILEDDQGYIWAATYNGLNLIQPTGEVVAIFQEEDGLTHNEFNRYAHCKAADGRLLFGTVDGLNVIDPIKAKEDLQSSGATKIYVSRLSYFDSDKDEIVHQRNYEAGERKLKLPADKRFISIRVGASNYGQNTKNRYAYRLKGIEADWTYMGNEHFIRLPNLPSGKYDLEIIAVDHNGNKAFNTIRIPIHAQEFFYKQAWFYMLMAFPFLVFGLLWVARLRKEKVILEKEVDKRTAQIRKDKELIEQQASELQQLDQMKSRFFANISHDFRTPLTLITGPAEVMKNDEALPQKANFKQGLKSILQNGKKLLNLVDEMLDLAKLESNEVKLHEEPLDLFRFCKSAYSSFQAAAERQQIEYELNYQPDQDYAITTDPRRLERILNNLLSNAFKFTEAKGKVSLAVYLKDETVCFEVKDTGRGIPPEDLPHVFDRFFQSKQAALVMTTGSGIGLSLSQELAHLLGGSITVVSTVGKGSTFTLLLPVVRAEQPSNAAAVSDLLIPDTVSYLKEAPTTANEEQFRILVVEDNLEVQSFLSSLLSDTYQVVTANDGQEALNYLQKQPEKESKKIDLVLSDVNMPVMDGYELLSILKKDEQLRQLPVIMLTAKTKERSKFKALRLGVDDYLTKPFSPTELLLRIQNRLDNYQKRLAFQQAFLQVKPIFEEAPAADQVWLQELEAHALKALDQKIDLNVSYLAGKMALSNSQLGRRVKLLTGLSIGKYISEIKLQKARHLLEQKAFSTVAEVGYACGFNSASYFSKIFMQAFGKSPTAYL
jgi:signal transduction histidine kinase/CheY-like chemotaxis protein